MKIYVASSWRNEIQPEVVRQLRRAGHEVYDFKNQETAFAWPEIDPNWEKWTLDEGIKALHHPTAAKAFINDFEAMEWAECCVLVMPCGRSAHIEAGWMQGKGKPVIVMMWEAAEPELMYNVFEKICVTIGDVLDHLEVLSLLNVPELH